MHYQAQKYVAPPAQNKQTVCVWLNYADRSRQAFQLNDQPHIKRFVFRGSLQGRCILFQITTTELQSVGFWLELKDVFDRRLWWSCSPRHPAQRIAKAIYIPLTLSLLLIGTDEQGSDVDENGYFFFPDYWPLYCFNCMELSYRISSSLLNEWAVPQNAVSALFALLVLENGSFSCS